MEMLQLGDTVDDDDDVFHLEEEINIVEEDGEIKLPKGLKLLDSQVAGHSYDSSNGIIGMLKRNGRIYKPGIKEALYEREKDFYEKIKTSSDEIYKALSKITPEYFGSVEFNVNKKPVKFLILQDITEGMIEPCVMDIKIGKRTWDPLAGPAKKLKEEFKYKEFKQIHSLCIPGFQYYDITTGNFRKFDKNYGKKIKPDAIFDVLRMFCNITQEHLCRSLIVQILASLWEVLSFFRLQTDLRFYSSSILIAYDAKRLKKIIAKEIADDCNGKCYELHPRVGSPMTSPSHSAYSSGFSSPRCISPLSSSPASNQFLKINGKNTLEKSNSDHSINGSNRYLNIDSNNVKLCRTHSFDNNFERDIMEMKDDYVDLLDQLTNKLHRDWVRVKMIDFTHVFPTEVHEVDANYLQGLENLIKIFESFLICSNDDMSHNKK
ncbi:inositol polyphosphate multikinase [Microplitis mediator]|uniref:inositol polyphosphate multikinase n=1 Tax=Microplitis mediator TaxID=375433 RepID=UPI002554E5C6|nr:inositol polyphosphate multikinase [Microplitis mediator]